MIGRSGAGKSTLLRMINRLAEPSEGRILFEGVDVTALRGKDLRQWRSRSAMIFQQFNLVGRLDVLTNVLMGRLAEIPSWRSLTQLWPEQDKALAMSALEQFDMASLAAQRADQLSGGQQQRVAIARALVQEPDILLADEPIASLDPHNTRIVMDALLRINKHFGITVICNLHSLDLARSYCDRLIGMSAGRVVFDGAPATLTDLIARGFTISKQMTLWARLCKYPTMPPFRGWAPPLRPEDHFRTGRRRKAVIGANLRSAKKRNRNKRA